MNPSARSKEDFPNHSDSSPTFLPDICQLNAVFFLLLGTQLFALMATLIVSKSTLLDWETLGALSVYSHCIVLSCAAILCASQKRLSQKSVKTTAFVCLLIILLVSGLISSLFIAALPTEFYTNKNDLFAKTLIISAIIGGLVLRYRYLQHQWEIHRQAELRARLEALQARIRPHFLFNSMNSIASLVTIDADRAEEAILDLSELFRATLQTQKMLISVSDELDLCKRYLNIEGLRLGSRLQVEWRIESEISQFRLPPLTLQPLIENAIYHGIQPLTEGGCIRIEGYTKADTAYLLIRNPMPKKGTQHCGNQIALDNIDKRFKALFGPGALIKTSHQDDNFTVTLRFPRDDKL